MATEPLRVKFKAEIKQCMSSTAASLDKGYKLVLVTDDQNLMNLSVLDSDVLVDVTVETES